MSILKPGMALAGSLLLTAAAFAQENETTITNSLLEVKVDTASGKFTVRSLPAGRTFVKDGSLSEGGGAAIVNDIKERSFGRGQAVLLTHTSGDVDSIMLFPNAPFVLFRSTLRNPGSVPIVKQKVQLLSATVDVGRPASELKSFGTGGLLDVDKNPGSYVWLAVAEPRSRNGVVSGWLTDNRGSGVIFSEAQDGLAKLEAQIDYGRLRIAPGNAEELEAFAIGWFDDARLGLEAWADAVAREYSIKLPPQPAGYCTWYSKPYGGAADETHLAELSAFAATNLAPFGFSVVQIDDHWQAGVSTNGPKRNFTEYAENGPYPHGMKPAAKSVKSLGLTPGIWFMPFAGTSYDPCFKDHQDWFVKREDGQPYETAWGGTCLDMTQSGARDHLREVVHTLTGWGFEYFKIDGLWTGTATKQQYVNSGYKDDGIGDAVLSNPEKTNIEAYRDGLKLVRDAAGRKVFILGCNGPQNMRSYGGAFGLVDAMRIGPDNGADWEKLMRGPTFGSRHYFLHGRIWYNDPDPVYVRESVPLEQARLLCTWVAISGQLNLSSEWLPGLPPERLEILKQTMPAHGLLPRPVDLFEGPVPRVWLLTDERHAQRRDVIGLFNWDDVEKQFDLPLDRIGLPGGKAYVAFDYWQDKLVTPLKDRLQFSLPPKSCSALAVRALTEHPQLLSTSRHVTQGIVEVLEEIWDAKTASLHGRSKVVGGDPYELRIVAGTPGKPWTAEAVEISPKELKASLKQDGELVRVRLESPTSRELSWSVRFKSGK